MIVAALSAGPSFPLVPNVLLLLPLMVALVVLIGSRLTRKADGFFQLLSVGSAAVCFIASCILLGVSREQAPVDMFPFLVIDEGKTLNIWIAAILDRQSAGMMFIVTLIGLLVQVFSLAYMKDDDAKPRYFGALSLFMFSMTGIVLAENLVMMFIFWELVGLSSYLLIGHWFQKPAAADASKKAFITNRIGDFGFMIGILLLFGANHGNVSFIDLQESVSEGTLKVLAQTQPWFMTAAVLCLFMGAVGKSAQLPLHVWLPDAMEGPTPVSALIHAATMVAAGVYMMVRISFLVATTHTAAMWIAGVGGVTALMAALMATQQNDIKRILAYSTLSQLGYMVMAVGLVAMGGHGHGEVAEGHPAMFHLYTHAFFKALLFLGSGAVIYACHHEQDIWKMGGLSQHMKGTTVTFAIGTAALMGVPWITSGFYSKEGILIVAWNECKVLFTIGAVTAALTAFYMTRLFVVAFLGKPRSDNAKHAMDVGFLMMLPLLVLAALSLVSGFPMVADGLKAMMPKGHHAGGTAVLAISLVALIVGVGLGWVLYKGKDKDPLKISLFANKFYIDEIYAVLVKVFQDGLAWVVTGLERLVADGIVARLPTMLATWVGARARALQGGHLQSYTLLLGAGLLLAIYLIVFVLPGAAGVGH
ncbi:MAG: NADH-quinone oxidoreductase subunit L [Verrucomicrobiales bacterium]|nr:NADH-quinone oxidoreductase subunit L [Verrucomicrobiales bacterium]